MVYLTWRLDSTVLRRKIKIQQIKGPRTTLSFLMQTKLQITLLKISTNNLSNLGAQDYLKFPNADKVTDNAVENFCKQFVEKIFSIL